MGTTPLIYLIAGLGTVNGLVFGIYLLFTKIGRRQANVFLGIFLILISVRFFRSIHFYYFGLDRPLFLIGHAAFLLAIPFIYLYYKSSFKEGFSPGLADLIHLLPLGVMFIHSFNLKNIVAFSILLIYAFLSHHKLLQFAARTRSSKIPLKSHNYNWYRNLLYILYINATLYITNLVFHFIPYILGAVSYSLVFYLMLFYWSRYQQYHKQRKILQNYQASGLTNDEAELYKESLFEKIGQDKLYTDPSLTLKKLAELLSIPYYQLSQIINQKLGKNFTEFINEYRIAEAKKLLSDPDYSNEKIESIAYESGFNTPSSFYVAFKKFTHSTPSQYRKQSPVVSE
ncbi:MAG: helix-turn-helix domain-containing protein [Bacteroidales bacterium]|nr:helix-turn-helix domain-containing protein [Bacteroidales bacterium]